MYLEFCAENFTDIPEKIQQGIHGVELCDNLAMGGTTPSLGVVDYTVEYCHKHGVSVMTMLRPRGGNFIYSEMEQAILLRDLEVLVTTGTDGIVFGALKGEWIDTRLVEEVVTTCQRHHIDFVFHMAFDQLSESNQFKAIDWLAEHGTRRILTHGGVSGTSIMDNIDHLMQLKEHAGDRIQIMPGGGVTHENLPSLHQFLNLEHYHGTKIVE